jgi:enoyl-CoA hydratase
MPCIDLPSYEHVRLSKNGAVLTATITNPARKNAVNPGIQADLARLWRDVDRDDDVRCVILTGAGGSFLAGLGLTALSSAQRIGRWEKGVVKNIRDRIFDILDCETPVIAKVRGPAYGMGINLALAADFVLAADTARFCDSHIKNGIAAGDGGVPLIPMLIGFRRAKEMLMLGDPISGTEARHLHQPGSTRRRTRRPRRQMGPAPNHRHSRRLQRLLREKGIEIHWPLSSQDLRLPSPIASNRARGARVPGRE